MIFCQRSITVKSVSNCSPDLWWVSRSRQPLLCLFLRRIAVSFRVSMAHLHPPGSSLQYNQWLSYRVHVCKLSCAFSQSMFQKYDCLEQTECIDAWQRIGLSWVVLILPAALNLVIVNLANKQGACRWRRFHTPFGFMGFIDMDRR